MWFPASVCMLAAGFVFCPTGNAEPAPGPSPPPVQDNALPGGRGNGIGGPGGPGGIASPPGMNFAPAGATVFMCAGPGAAADVLGFGGGYCNFNFVPVKLTETTYGVMHTHCEWGGARPIIEMWKCWRVFPGQPDHPEHPDPDVIPDGMGVPWAILGPTPENQWPPPGLAPGQELLNPPPPPEPHNPGPPPGPIPPLFDPLNPTGPPPGPPPEG
jgi:hypothetical protein